jgi:hypothetical protein
MNVGADAVEQVIVFERGSPVRASTIARAASGPNAVETATARFNSRRALDLDLEVSPHRYRLGLSTHSRSAMTCGVQGFNGREMNEINMRAPSPLPAYPFVEFHP